MIAQYEVVVDTHVARPRRHLATALVVATLACEVVFEFEARVVGWKKAIGTCQSTRIGELLGNAQIPQYHVLEAEIGGYVQAIRTILDTHGSIVERVGNDGALPTHGIVVEDLLGLAIGIHRDIVGVQSGILREGAVRRIATGRL